MCKQSACARPTNGVLLVLLTGLQYLKPCHGIMQEARAASVRALTDGVLLALHRDDFNKLLGSLSHIRHMWRFEALRKARLMLQASEAGRTDWLLCGPSSNCRKPFM